MRLLNLPETVHKLLIDGRLSAGHARALVGNDDAAKLADHIVRNGLSVRDAERLAKSGIKPKGKASAGKKTAIKDADTAQIEAELSAALGMKVSIDHSAGSEGGRLSVNYRNLDQLDDLLRALFGG